MPDIACLEQLRDLILGALAGQPSVGLYSDWDLMANSGLIPIFAVPGIGGLAYATSSQVNVEEVEPDPGIAEGLSILGQLRTAISQMPEIEDIFENARLTATAFADEYGRRLSSVAAQIYTEHPTVILSAAGETSAVEIANYPSKDKMMEFDLDLWNQIVALVDGCLRPQLEGVDDLALIVSETVAPPITRPWPGPGPIGPGPGPGPIIIPPTPPAPGPETYPWLLLVLVVVTALINLLRRKKRDEDTVYLWGNHTAMNFTLRPDDLTKTPKGLSLTTTFKSDRRNVVIENGKSHLSSLGFRIIEDPRPDPDPLKDNPGHFVIQPGIRHILRGRTLANWAAARENTNNDDKNTWHPLTRILMEELPWEPYRPPKSVVSLES